MYLEGELYVDIAVAAYFKIHTVSIALTLRPKKSAVLLAGTRRRASGGLVLSV
jgi:hypothetical protein